MIAVLAQDRRSKMEIGGFIVQKEDTNIAPSILEHTSTLLGRLNHG